MYGKILITVMSTLFICGAHASQTMVFNGQIKNFLSRPVQLLSPSWDVGNFPEDELVVDPKGHIKFNFPAHAYRGAVKFVLSTGRTKGEVACLYDVKYGTQSYVRGAVTLTGPRATLQASSAGKRQADCSLKLDNWDYERSMDMRFVIRRSPA
ncbi:MULTISPECIES: hypothetical protein [unclassified Pseudomonas]|uniref:hypothetical protein n=1 Tax=unclassified Pseudomonas TaxID=196821 RepID=UPI0025E6E76B|nr:MULTISPECIES: hypothetical protein [unclassified Pseudomonas]